MSNGTMTLAAAEALVARVLVRCGTGEHNAASVARALVRAEAVGLRGHGLSRVASYAAQVRTGKVDGRATPVITRPKPGVVAIDAAHGFAYPALDAAVAALPDVARAQGVAVAAIRRSHHCGAAGLPVEALADAGLVALLFANTPAAMAPWGGRTAVFGTNPIAFACPRGAGAPIVVDLALSRVARGNIVAAKQRGTAIPEGWALDAEGRPTADPEAALGGTMAPLGDAKGTALALMVELLAAGLTGSNFAAHASSFLDDKGDPPGTGQLVVALDPGPWGALARSTGSRRSPSRSPDNRERGCPERAGQPRGGRRRARGSPWKTTSSRTSRHSERDLGDQDQAASSATTSPLRASSPAATASSMRSSHVKWRLSRTSSGMSS